MASGKKKALPRCIEFGPPEMTPEEKEKAEKGFILDGVAVATFSDDSGHASPKLSTAIPPYNAQKDKHTQGYFKTKDVTRTLRKTNMVKHYISIFSNGMIQFSLFSDIVALCKTDIVLESFTVVLSLVLKANTTTQIYYCQRTVKTLHVNTGKS